MVHFVPHSGKVFRQSGSNSWKDGKAIFLSCTASRRAADKSYGAVASTGLVLSVAVVLSKHFICVYCNLETRKDATNWCYWLETIYFSSSRQKKLESVLQLEVV